MSLISIVLPARNEERGLEQLILELKRILPHAEIIVVNDDSTDNTHSAAEGSGAKVISHRYCMGNGAAIKTGARAADGDVLILMDADGQHNPEDLPRLINKFAEGFDMVVGAREPSSQASFSRRIANLFYNRLASWMVGQRIDDLTSGLRIVRADKFREFLPLLPNGFSYPTTSTVCFFRAGYGVGYVPIRARKRFGNSHINPLRDGIRFFLIIFKIGTLYSPLKLFLPISLGFFVLGIGYYGYTFMSTGRFTNMSALLITTSVLVFLIGLVSEQITSLIYTRK